MPEPILCLLDASVYARSVCDLAVWCAKGTGADIRLLHVLDPEKEDATLTLDSEHLNTRLYGHNELIQEMHDLELAKARIAQKLGQAILDDAKHYLESYNLTNIETRMRHDTLINALDVYAPHSSVIIMGKRGEDADDQKRHLGAHFESVVRSSERPILIASSMIKPIKKVMIAFDGGALIKRAVDDICTNPLFNDVSTVLAISGPMNKDVAESYEFNYQKLAKAGRNPEMVKSMESVEKMVSNTIESHDIDLLVMGAFNHSKLRNLLFGSISQTIIRNVTVPVLIVRDIDKEK